MSSLLVTPQVFAQLQTQYNKNLIQNSCPETRKQLDKVNEINQKIRQQCPLQKSGQKSSSSRFLFVQLTLGAAVGIAAAHYFERNPSTLFKMEKAFETLFDQAAYSLEHFFERAKEKVLPQIEQSCEQAWEKLSTASVPDPETILSSAYAAACCGFAAMTSQNKINRSLKNDLGQQAVELQNSLETIERELQTSGLGIEDTNEIVSIFKREIAILNLFKESASSDLSKAGLTGSLMLASAGAFWAAPYVAFAGLGLALASTVSWGIDRLTSNFSSAKVAADQAAVEKDLGKYLPAATA